MTNRKKEYPWEAHYPEGINWRADIPVKPLYSVLDESVKNFPDNVCIDYYGKKYTYAEVGQLVDRMAKGLQEQGVKKGSKVGLLLPNCPVFIVAYYAILKAGGIVVNYNPLYTINEIVHQVKDSGTTIMITLDIATLYEKTSNLLQTTSLEKVIVSCFKDMLPFPKDMLFGMFKGQEVASVHFGRVNVSINDVMDNDGDYEKVDIKPEEDVAVLQYTGGTTGMPKGAMLTHANLYANTVQNGMWFRGLEEGNEKMLGVLPFFHIFAMTVVMNLSIYKACEIVIHSRFDVAAALKDIEKKKITLMPGVPTLFAAVNNYKKVTSYDLSSMKFCISGGAPLPAEVRRQFEELTECNLIEGYGLTECSPVAAANPLFGEVRDGSIGIPFPGTVIEIIGTEGRKVALAKGKVGEVCIKGPQVMIGYHGSDNETKEVLKGGRLHTGDLGYMDKDGYIFVVDRIKEMIITSGFNVYPREVEEVIYKHPAVEEVSVVGVDNNYRGQAVKAFIKLKAGEKLDESEIKGYLDGKLAKYKIPTIIEFRDELPKTMVGKISKKDLVGQEAHDEKPKKEAKKKTAKNTRKKAG